MKYFYILIFLIILLSSHKGISEESKTEKLLKSKLDYHIFSQFDNLSDDEWNSIKNEYLIYSDKYADIEKDSSFSKNDTCIQLKTMSLRNKKPELHTEYPHAFGTIMEIKWNFGLNTNVAYRQYSIINIHAEYRITNFLNLLTIYNVLTFKEHYKNTKLNSYCMIGFTPGFSIPIYASSCTLNDRHFSGHFSTNKVDEISYSARTMSLINLRILLGTLGILDLSKKFIDDKRDYKNEHLINYRYSLNTELFIHYDIYFMSIGTSYKDNVITPYISFSIDLGYQEAKSILKF